MIVNQQPGYTITINHMNQSQKTKFIRQAQLITSIQTEQEITATQKTYTVGSTTRNRLFLYQMSPLK